jgi:hypothetical protein
MWEALVWIIAGGLAFAGAMILATIFIRMLWGRY